jgi:hypothetical protein
MTVEKIMTDIDLEILKKQIESLREEINTYIEYPEIFKDELIETSSKIDELINKYINVAK